MVTRRTRHVARQGWRSDLKYRADGTVDWNTFSGFRRYHSACIVCHGPDGEGSSYAPALANSLKTIGYADFFGIVVGGKKDLRRPGHRHARFCRQQECDVLSRRHLRLSARALARDRSLVDGRPNMKRSRPAFADAEDEMHGPELRQSLDVDQVDAPSHGFSFRASAHRLSAGRSRSPWRRGGAGRGRRDRAGRPARLSSLRRPARSSLLKRGRRRIREQDRRAVRAQARQIGRLHLLSRRHRLHPQHAECAIVATSSWEPRKATTSFNRPTPIIGRATPPRIARMVP